MEETETPHPDYIKGYNEGYLLSKHLPDLSDKLASAVLNSQRGSGFQDGVKQQAYEKGKKMYPSWLKEDRLDTLDNSTEPSKDRDADGPER